jgi:hypothetical protein
LSGWGREADHPPATTAKVKNLWGYTSTSHTFRGVVLYYARGQLHLFTLSATSIGGEKWLENLHMFTDKTCV